MFEQYLAISTLEWMGVVGYYLVGFVVVIAVLGFLFAIFVCHNYICCRKKHIGTLLATYLI